MRDERIWDLLVAFTRDATVELAKERGAEPEGIMRELQFADIKDGDPITVDPRRYPIEFLMHFCPSLTRQEAERVDAAARREMTEIAVRPLRALIERVVGSDDST